MIILALSKLNIQTFVIFFFFKLNYIFPLINEKLNIKLSRQFISSKFILTTYFKKAEE